MPRPGEDDREAVDRAFADLVAGYHLTSDRPDPLAKDTNNTDLNNKELPAGSAPDPGTTETSTGPAATTIESPAPDTGWADVHPLFSYTPPPDTVEDEATEERFVPQPPGPLPKPAWPVLLAWIGMGYAMLAVLATALGAQLPSWAGWLALIGFVGGFAILVTRLPRHRPPDAGNGAVL
jgi:hypothetical protein